MKIIAILFFLAAACSGQTWSGCTSPVSRQSFLYVTPTGAPNPRTMFVTLNSNSTNTPPGGIWSTSNLCPTSTGQWTSVTGNRAGNISARSSTGELYFDNANAGTVPNTSHVRYLAGNTVLTDTASPVNGWACAPDATRDVIVCMERNGDIFSSADNFTSALSTNRCSGSPITGMSVTADGIWWALCESINSSRSTNAGSSWSNIGSVGGAGTQIVKLQNGQYIDCDGEGNAYPRIWDGATTWNQLSGSSFPGANGTVACSRMTAVGSDIWMVANDTTFNPIVYKTSTGTGAWTAETGTGLPSACTSKCQPRDVFYDATSGYVYLTILGSGGQATSIYRALVGTPPPQPWRTAYYFQPFSGSLPVSAAPFSKYTHVTQANVLVTSACGIDTSTYAITGNIAPFVSAVHGTGAKALVTMLGDSARSADMQTCTDSSHVSAFATTIANFVNTNGYDGFDLDWEVGIIDAQWQALVNRLRTAMSSKTLTVSVTVSDRFNVNLVQTSLDQVNIMNYDDDVGLYSGAWATDTWYNSAILAGGDTTHYSAETTLNYFLSAGVAPGKIGIGIPFYERIKQGCLAGHLVPPCNQQVTTPLQSYASGDATTNPRTAINYNDLLNSVYWSSGTMVWDATHGAQYILYNAGYPNQAFVPYTGVEQIQAVVNYTQANNLGGVMVYELSGEYISSASGNARYPLSTALYAPPPPFPVDSRGWVVTGLSPIQDNLLGPLIPSGNSPWIFGDLAESGTADNMAVNALIETPTLGTACPGTVSFTSGTSIVTTTSNISACIAGKTYLVIAWDSIDGAGTGRAQCPIASYSFPTLTCQENLFEPTSSGVTAYNMPGPGPSGFDFLGWTAERPSVSWNYYDVAIGLYRLYYRTGNATYLTQARAYADITWQWTLDHGYRFVTPRAASMISQFFRAGEGHQERLPGLYGWISHLATAWVPTFCPYCDNREVGYMTWDEALGAKVDTDPTRHAQYCSWLSTYVPQWNSVQSADGSFGENEYALNPTFVSAPKTFSAPFLYQGAPWRVAITVKALEAAYESLSDTSMQGCSDLTLAAATLTTITNAVTWQRNYGRDSVNRGIYYEVNSQSDDQDSVFPGGTVSVNLTSTSVLGSGTNWNSAGYCDGTHFIGIAGPNDPRTVYKIASCLDDTHLTLSVAFGLYGESMNATSQSYGIAPAAFTGCHSSATYCFGSAGDSNLTRTVAGGTAWLYAKTLNLTYKTWTDDWLSIQLGGPTAGLTSAANEGAITLPCSGPACIGLVTDTWEAAKNCGQTVPINTAPCLYGNTPLSNLGKNFGEAFGAPGIDNALAWRLIPTGGTRSGGKITFGGARKQ